MREGCVIDGLDAGGSNTAGDLDPMKCILDRVYRCCVGYHMTRDARRASRVDLASACLTLPHLHVGALTVTLTLISGAPPPKRGFAHLQAVFYVRLACLVCLCVCVCLYVFACVRVADEDPA